MLEAGTHIAERSWHHTTMINTEKYEVACFTSNLHEARWQPTVHLEHSRLGIMLQTLPLKTAARCGLSTSLTSKLKSTRRPDIWSPCIATLVTCNPPPEVLGCYNYEEDKASLPLALDWTRSNCPSAYTLITGTRHFLDALKGDVKRKPFARDIIIICRSLVGFKRLKIGDWGQNNKSRLVEPKYRKRMAGSWFSIFFSKYIFSSIKRG